MDVQPFSVARRHVDTLHVDGLRIQVPPGDARETLRTPGSAGLNPSKVMVDRLITHDAELAFVPSKPEHRPHVFRIPAELAPGSAAAASIGLINSIGNLGGFVGPYVVGYLNTKTNSFYGGMLYLAVSSALGGVCIQKISRDIL